MRIGFTGTQSGMNKWQKFRVQEILEQHSGEFHHVDCVGADEEAGEIAWNLGYRVVLHPPVIGIKRAYTKLFHECREPKPYLERNHDIVDDTQGLVAAPKELEEILRSGTWATIRYADKRERGICVCRIDDGVTWRNSTWNFD